MSDVKQSGFYVCGQVVGFAERPWQSDPSKVNYEIGIGRPYTNDFGQPDVDVTRVQVPADRAAELRAVVEKLRGKFVSVRVVVNARKGGRDGAFLSVYMPRTSDLVPQ